MNVKGIFSHQSDHWSTPKDIYDYWVGKMGYFDPCPLHCKDFDGLKIDWHGDVFINPPYSDVERWVDKAIEYHSLNPFVQVAMLLPVRTDTKWFKKLFSYGCLVSFYRGRLKFGGSKLGAPFPSMLVQLGGFNRFLVIERATQL